MSRAPITDNLAFLNALSGRLGITLSEEPKQVSPNLMNVAAPPSATLLEVSLRFEVFEDGEFRALTEEEWARVVIHAPSIRMRSRDVEQVVEVRAPNGVSFNVKDLEAAIEQTERVARAQSTWLGGIDVHHVYFEGIEREADGAWRVNWGS